jgi:tyrosine-protein kinase Etk/Wzc
MQDQQNTNRNELGNLTIKDLFFKYVRFLPLFALSTALALFGAYIYLRYTTKIYSVRSSLMIKNEAQSQSKDRFDDLLGGGSKNSIQSEIEVLKSRPLMERVVSSLGLNVNYFAVGKFKSPNIYKSAPFHLKALKIADSSGTFVTKINFVNGGKEFRINGELKHTYKFGEYFQNSNGVFKIDQKPGILIGNAGKDYNVVWSPTLNIANNYSGALNIREKTFGTGILNITMETENSYLGADIVNQLMKEYQLANKDEKNKTAQQTLDFIDTSLKRVTFERDSVSKELLDYREKNNIIDYDAQSRSYFDNLSQADKEMNVQTAYLGVADMLDNYLRDKNNKYTPVPSSLGITDETLTSLADNYNKTQLLRKNYLESNISSESPVLKETESQIEELRTKLVENLKNIKITLKNSIADLQRRSSIAQSSASQLPAKLQCLLVLERVLGSKKAIEEMLMQKRIETSISKASTIPNSRIIDEALPDNNPIKPNRRTIQMLAILIGLGLPALFIFILEVANDKITNRFDIEKLTAAAILGEVGHSFAESSLVVNKTNRNMVAEQFRIIRSNLQYVLNKVDKQIILITSSFSGEGKSFISTNLAGVMALAGKKTIILEFDIRKPKILSGLNMSKKPGISNFLVGKAKIEDLPVQVTDYENLYVLPCGPVPPNPSELLLDPKMDQLFDYLKNNFDVIIVDTAPVGMVSDALTLGKFADCTLYIARQGYTFKKQVILIDEIYQQAKLPKVAIIINDVKIKPGYGYYGYGRYGYGKSYGYGQGYYEEEKALPFSLRKTMKGFINKLKRRVNFFNK